MEKVGMQVSALLNPLTILSFMYCLHLASVNEKLKNYPEDYDYVDIIELGTWNSISSSSSHFQFRFALNFCLRIKKTLCLSFFFNCDLPFLDILSFGQAIQHREQISLTHFSLQCSYSVAILLIKSFLIFYLSFSIASHTIKIRTLFGSI